MDPIWLANKTQNLPDLSLLNSKWQTFFIIIYTTTAIISLASNIVTIIVLVKGERLSSELWKYLINLSVADISMALFCIPFTYTMFMLGHWVFPVWLCPVVQFTQVCSVMISVYTLTIIGIDRSVKSNHMFCLIINYIIDEIKSVKQKSILINKWHLFPIVWITLKILRFLLKLIFSNSLFLCLQTDSLFLSTILCFQRESTIFINI